ncbi:hypothetical protein J2X72_004423, partial [Phyllobacterium sp. 1468]|nr:hypothetical protein [Phyllobacterium sp. 1468]
MDYAIFEALVGTFYFQLQQILNPLCFQEDAMPCRFRQLNMN